MPSSTRPRDAGKLAELASIKAQISARLHEQTAPAKMLGGPTALESAVASWRKSGAFGDGPRNRAELFEDFDKATFGDWSTTGPAFGPSPTRPGDFRVGSTGAIPLPSGLAHGGAVSERLQGVLRSKTFVISKKYMHFLVAGRQGRINIVVENFEKIKNPIYGDLTAGVDHGDELRWMSRDVSMWLGRDAYLELGDGATLDYTSGAISFFPGDGHVAVDEIWFSDDSTPPRKPLKLSIAAESAERVLNEAIADWRGGRPLDFERAAFLSQCVARGRLAQRTDRQRDQEVSRDRSDDRAADLGNGDHRRQSSRRTSPRARRHENARRGRSQTVSRSLRRTRSTRAEIDERPARIGAEDGRSGCGSARAEGLGQSALEASF